MSEDDPNTTDDEAFETTLRERFRETDDVETDLATTAAAKAAAFRAEVDDDLTVEQVLEATGAAPYESFEHRFDHAIGDLAAANEDCTDSRAYRLSGFGDLAADPQQGA